MLRVTKSGGAISFVVWGQSELNPFSDRITNVVARYCDVAPAEPNSPGAFRFAEPGVLAGLLSDAGAKDVKERELTFQIAAAISLEQFWEMRSETSEILRAKLATLSQPQAELLAREAQEAVREFFVDNQMSIPAQMIIVTARKP